MLLILAFTSILPPVMVAFAALMAVWNWRAVGPFCLEVRMGKNLARFLIFPRLSSASSTVHGAGGHIEHDANEVKKPFDPGPSRGTIAIR